MDTAGPEAVWTKCFDCMERKTKELEKRHKKAAELWNEKLKRCKECKEQFFAEVDTREDMSPSEGWAHDVQKCTSCLLDDLERMTTHPHEARVYSELTKSCIECMYSELPE